MYTKKKQLGPTAVPAQPDIHHAFHRLITNSPQSIAFLYGSRFTNAMKEAASNAAVLFNVTAAQAIEELRRLLALKVFARDDQGRKIGATPLMDHMWQASILDIRLYQELLTVFPFFLHYPRPGQQRLITTETLYNRFFSTYPLGSSSSLTRSVET